MKSKILLSMFISLKGNILSAHPSLFFTNDEIGHIRKCLAGKEVLGNMSQLFLSGIVFLDEEHWSLWVNNKIIRPENRHEIEGFYLEQVRPKGVKFSWIPSGTSNQILFTLHPYQTYVPIK